MSAKITAHIAEIYLLFLLVMAGLAVWHYGWRNFPHVVFGWVAGLLALVPYAAKLAKPATSPLGTVTIVSPLNPVLAVVIFAVLVVVSWYWARRSRRITHQAARKRYAAEAEERERAEEGAHSHPRRDGE